MRSNLLFRGSLIVTLLLAMSLNIAVAWACAMWNGPLTWIRPAEPTSGGEPAPIAGPEGVVSWWHIGRGVGWYEASPYGWRGADGNFLYWNDSGTPAIREAGWPMKAVRSVVSVIDSEYERNRHTPQRTRWQLPIREIIRRGIPTSDLPAWTRAVPNRRLPIVPMPVGFIVNTLFFALPASVIMMTLSRYRRIQYRKQRGFPIKVL